MTSLTTKLPFDDDEFDHVHMHGLGRGIPENKVRLFFLLYHVRVLNGLGGSGVFSSRCNHFLVSLLIFDIFFKEVNRVLRPGGVVEVLEDGIYFILLSAPL